MPRGRPRRTGVQHVYNLKLYLWEGEDDDLIAFLEGIPPRRRVAALKTALRSGGGLNLWVQSLPTDAEAADADMDLDAFLFD